jgi:hypothetical protein
MIFYRGTRIIRDCIVNNHVHRCLNIAISGHENDGRPMEVREKTLKAQGVGIWQAQFHPGVVRDRITILLLSLISICVCLFLEPRPHAEPVYADAKQVCWNKAKL